MNPFCLARDNPFRADRIEALPWRDAEADVATVLGRFNDLAHRGVLVGPHGSGKTTLREHLEARLRDEGWYVHNIVLHDDRPLPALLPPDLQLDRRSLVSIDGLDRLSAPRWWWLRCRMRAAGGMLATSHRRGRLPLLHQHHSSPELLLDLVRELIGAADCTRFADDLRHLHQQHHGNIRACLGTAYDRVANGSWHLHAGNG